MKGITFFLLLVSFSALYSQPITLRDTTNQYDYIIITMPEFENACEPFKQHKETVRNFRTLMLTQHKSLQSLILVQLRRVT